MQTSVPRCARSNRSGTARAWQPPAPHAASCSPLGQAAGQDKEKQRPRASTEPGRVERWSSRRQRAARPPRLNDM
eukprot:5379386-Pyramimonas_sp.AAC.1